MYSTPRKKKHGAASTCVERMARIGHPRITNRAAGKSPDAVAALSVTAQRRADSTEASAPAFSPPRGGRRRSESFESPDVYSGYGPARPEGHPAVFGNSKVAPDLRGVDAPRALFSLGDAPSQGGSSGPILYFYRLRINAHTKIHNSRAGAINVRLLGK